MKFQWMWRKIEDHYIVILTMWLLVYVVWKWWISRANISCMPQKRKMNFRCFHLFLIVSGGVYAVLFLYVTLLSREFKSELQYQLSFLWEYRLAFDFSGESGFIRSITWVRQIRDNILLFVPMGVLFGEMMNRWPKRVGERRKRNRRSYRAGKGRKRGVCSFWWGKALITGFLLSLTVELIQLIFRLGLFEFDDMFNNTIGMMLGYGFYAFWRGVYNFVYQPSHKRRKNKKETSTR